MEIETKWMITPDGEKYVLMKLPATISETERNFARNSLTNILTEPYPVVILQGEPDNEFLLYGSAQFTSHIKAINKEVLKHSWAKVEI